MYQEEQLKRYPFFRELLREAPLSAILDSLTGVVARPYMLRFIRSLIAEGTPFTMSIVDLDNFKSVNDNYGHRTGDAVLTGVCGDLRTYVGERGVVGRFGGDEFLFVWFGGTGYDEVHAFFSGMFRRQEVFRRECRYGDADLTMTGTCGIVRFPRDAPDFPTLFSLADKVLYRGKTKGRNCFIIYLPEKHAHLHIPSLVSHSLYETLRCMAEGFDRAGTPEERLRRAFQPVREQLRMTRLLSLNRNGVLTDVDSSSVTAGVESPEPLLSRGMLAASSLLPLQGTCPALYHALDDMGMESVLIVRAGTKADPAGYLVICPEVHTLHIWQDEELSAAFILSRMAGQVLQ